MAKGGNGWSIWSAVSPSFNSLRGGSSSSRSKSRHSALRVVSSETTPTPAQKPVASSPTAPGVPVSASFDSPSRDTPAPADVPDAVREQARLPDLQADSISFPPAPQPAKAHHVRAKSTTAVGEPSIARLDSPAARTIPRPRASSSATMLTQPRPRTRARLPSMLSSVLTNPRAAVQTRITATAESDLVGSFAPTSSPRERLLSLLSTDGVAPSPTPSAPPSPCRAPLRLSTEHVRGASAPAPKHRRRTASSPIDAPSSPTLPSICRTPSSYSGSDYFPTAPSSAGPATPVHVVAPLPPSLSRKSESLHPVLEGLERASMFAVQTACATCGRGGSNFPCCPKCGEMWCSRACRLQKGNGKRHICSARRG
ncbi:hypothetical protein TRAPUB_8186 [Trametes pubescens]|uniref:Uncharacterized protein n=1 Tax=Trametes pubescens TaxID=154538 RepID=A0A1M2W5W5_TRAPU|nr:hypothetical protein TRAPUB_8186 [Trametes pubescens]